MALKKAPAASNFVQLMNSAPSTIPTVDPHLIEAPGVSDLHPPILNDTVPSSSPTDGNGYSNPNVPDYADALAGEKRPGDPGYQSAVPGHPDIYTPTSGADPSISRPTYVDPLAGVAPPSNGQTAYPPDELAARRTQIEAQKAQATLIKWGLIIALVVAGYFLLRKRKG